MRKICIFCEKWASGGIESFIVNVLAHMDRQDIQIDIVAISVEESVFDNQLRLLGIAVQELSGNRNAVLCNAWRFWNLIQTKRYDVIHVNAFHAGSLAYLLLAKQAGISVRIAHSHNSAIKAGKYASFKRGVHVISRKMFTRYATHLWACSQTAAEFSFMMKKPSDARYRFIPNGIDIMRFAFDQDRREQIREKLGYTNMTVIGNTGRLCAQKNQSFLLRVFAEYLKEEPNSRLLLVGDGELKESLTQQAQELEISDKICLYGTTTQVECMLWAMDVFVFPSVFEGLGIAAIEAQAAGLPVICSESVPVEAIVLPSVKRISLQADLQNWVKALRLATSNQDDRTFGAIKMQASGFAIENVVSTIENTYQNENCEQER